MTAKGDTSVSSKMADPAGALDQLLEKSEKEEDEENEKISRPVSSLSDKQPESPEAKDNGLITMKVPTATKKSRKRRNILTNFDEDTLLDQVALDAQKKEKERLERLEKIEQTVSNTDHINQVAALQSAALHNPLPVIDLTENDFLFDDNNPPLLEAAEDSSLYKPEVIDLSSDDDDIQEVGSFCGSSIFSPKRNRWTIPEKEKGSLDEMDKQQRLEEERLKRKEHLLKDIEKMEISQGKLIVNKGHPPEDPDIAVAPHLTHTLQPHQLGGICFMYNNVIESFEEYRRSPGFGCILAHSMGLGKTLQIVTFTEIFFRATKAHKVLIIVPINTIQNWWNEFDKWMPEKDEAGNKIRQFNVYILGDTVKTFDQRVTLLETWTREGGALIIGYDMFRLLLRATQPKKKKPKMKLNFLNGQKIREEAPKEPDDFDIGLTTGGRVKKEANEIIRQALLDPGPELVVCDEGHKIKNLNTGISVALGAIKTTRRIVLTGYPLQNNLMEYYCMVDFVRPKYLGEKKTFSIMFERPIKNGSCVDATSADWKLAAQRTHVLVEKLRGFVQRRTHHLLKTILPQSREYVLLLRKSLTQHILYRNFLLYAQTEIRAGSNVFNPLKAFAACSKIWNHPDVLYRTLEAKKEKRKKELEAATAGSIFSSAAAKNSFWSMFGGNDLDLADFDEDSCSSSTAAKGKTTKKPQTLFSALMEEEDMDLENGLKYDWAETAMGNYKLGVLENGFKIKIAMEIINETIANEEKILLFSQNLTALDLIEQFLNRENLESGIQRWIKNKTYYRLDGSTNGTEREKLIKRFNSDESAKLFLISTRAGSLGINLVSANRCIILDACWNPCHDAQAVCRVYRYGQQKQTFIYRLIMDNSMEKAIFNRQVSKHGLQQRVVDDAKVNANVTQRELETLLMYDESLDVVSNPWYDSNWEVEDDILKKVVEKHKDMLSAEPFLHESLIVEREEGLSEQEKQEAKLLFERERMMELSNQVSTSSSRNNDVTPRMNMPMPSNMGSMNPNMGYHNYQNPWNGNFNTPPPLRATPVPYQLQYNNNNSGGYGQQNQMGNGLDGVHNGQMMPQVPVTQPMPYYRGNMMDPMGSNYGNHQDGYVQTGNGYNAAPKYNGYPTSDYVPFMFEDGSEAIPNMRIPGASRVSRVLANETGSMQKIIVDHRLLLPECNNHIPVSIGPEEEATLIRSGPRVFLKTRWGAVLDANGTIFDMGPVNLPPPVLTTEVAPLPQLGPADLIELD